VKIGRKNKDEAVAEVGVDEPAVAASETPDAGTKPTGPLDISEADLEDGADRVDLGGILLAAAPGLEVRLEVDEQSGQIRSVVYAGEDGALEVRAFASSRGESMWDEVRPAVAAEVASLGGQSVEFEGRWGTELACQLEVQLPDGQTGIQPSRVIGVDGPRWFVRATYLGRPAVEPESASTFDAALEALVVRRGSDPMPPGEHLPLVLPPQARRVEA